MERRTAVLTAWSEMYAALERGVIDAGKGVEPYEDTKLACTDRCG